MINYTRIFFFGLLCLLGNVAFGAALELTWEHATTRVDGSAITGVRKYHIKHYVDNGAASYVEVDGALTTFQIDAVTAGMHTFQIATSEDGQMGDFSDPVVVSLSDKEVALPSSTVLTIRLTDCVDCGLEIR